MSDHEPSKPYVWKNPLAVWGTASGNAEAPSTRVPDPRDTWRKNTAFKVPPYPVGRLKYFLIWPHHGNRTWNRTRWWPTRRNLLNIRGLYNRKTARPEKLILDRRPIYWVLSLFLLLIGPLLFPQGQMNALLTAGATFGIFAAINVCWTLIIGTASIFSLATYAVVGTAAFVTSLLSIRAGSSLVCAASDRGRHWAGLWHSHRRAGASARRLLLCASHPRPERAFPRFLHHLQTVRRSLGRALWSRFPSSARAGHPSPNRWSLTTPRCPCLSPRFSSFRFINGKRFGRVLRMAPEKHEAFAAASGVDFKRARITIFLLTSVALGFIGGFYAAQYRGVAYSIFDFQTVLLGLAMITIGGIGRAEGAVLGTLVVIFLRDVLLELGPWRYLIIGAAMLGVVLFLNNGYFGIRRQFNAWRAKKRGEWRSTRTEKGGETLPEEATESNDKDAIYFRRFDKMQRDYLKGLITPEIIEEHRRQPLGQHSEATRAHTSLFPTRQDGGQIRSPPRGPSRAVQDHRLLGRSRRFTTARR